MQIRTPLFDLDNCDMFIFSHRRRLVQIKPLFFYHIPKTGGITFRTALTAALGFVHERDPTRNIEPPGPYFAINDPSDQKDFLNKYSAVFAWERFGFHNKFIDEFNFVTVLREPFSRVVSRFRYLCFMGEMTLSTAAFEEFFRAPPQQNHQTKLLAGCGDFVQVNDDHLSSAIENLEGFFAFATIENLNTLMENLLSAYDLPNVLGKKLNVSSPATHFDWEPYREENLALNAFDQRLYEYAKEHQRLCVPEENEEFQPLDDSGAINKFTVILREAPSVREFECLGYVTEQLEEDFTTVKQTKGYIEAWLEGNEES